MDLQMYVSIDRPVLKIDKEKMEVLVAIIMLVQNVQRLRKKNNVFYRLPDLSLLSIDHSMSV